MSTTRRMLKWDSNAGSVDRVSDPTSARISGNAGTGEAWIAGLSIGMGGAFLRSPWLASRRRRRPTLKITGVIRTACAPSRHLRVWAQWPCHVDPIFFNPGGDDPVRGMSGLRPPLHRCHRVELVWSGASTAVLNTRHHEQLDEIIRLRSSSVDNAIVVVDRALGGNQEIGPAMPQEEFPTARPEGAQVRVLCIQSILILLIGCGGVAGKLAVIPIPTLV